MSETKQAYPLQWPSMYPRTKSRNRSQFQTSFADARDNLVSELQRFGAKGIVISTNVPLMRNGMPQAIQGKGLLQDPGVAVYFHLRGRNEVLYCDHWDSVTDNLQAIRKTVEALRGIARWASSQIMEAAFSGLRALPSGEAYKPWYEVMGLSEHATESTVRSRYKALVLIHHPDKPTGNEAEFQRLQKAYNEAMELFKLETSK